MSKQTPKISLQAYARKLKREASLAKMITLLITSIIVLLGGASIYVWLFHGRNIFSFFHTMAAATGNAVIADILHRPRLDQENCEVEIIGADLSTEATSDWFSKPDPLIIVKHHVYTRKTEVERNTFKPRFLWKSRMPLFTKKGKGFSFNMVEHDAVGQDIIIGRAYLNSGEVDEMIKSNKARKISLGHGIGYMKIKITMMSGKYMEKRQAGRFSQPFFSEVDDLSSDEAEPKEENPSLKETGEKPVRRRSFLKKKNQKESKNIKVPRMLGGKSRRRPSWTCRPSSNDVVVPLDDLSIPPSQHSETISTVRSVNASVLGSGQFVRKKKN